MDVVYEMQAPTRAAARLGCSKALLTAMVMLLVIPAATKAEVLNFDDLSAAPNGVVPADYGGFDFGEGQFFLQSDDEYTADPPDGYGNTYSAPSAPYAAVNNPDMASVTIAREEPFDFLGASFAAFAAFDEFQDYSATSILIEGVRGGTVVGSVPADLAADQYQFIPADFQAIDAVVLTPTNASGGDAFFLMDDFTYQQVPEPASAFACGLLLALSLTRRRRQGGIGTGSRAARP